MENLLTLVKQQWYGWQMLPGYGEGYGPYYLPIFIEKVEPLKTGKGRLRIEFVNAMYAQGVQGFTIECKILERHRYYLMARLEYEDVHRNAVISEMSFEWIKQTFPPFWYQQPPSSFEGLARSECQYYLNQVFFRKLRPEFHE